MAASKRTGEIAKELTKIFPIFARKVHFEFFAHMEMTPLQFFVMLFLEERGDCSLGDVAKEFFIAAPTATGIVSRLVDAGYLTRKIAVTDRRVARVALTAKGRKILIELKKKKYAQAKQILGMLPLVDQEHHLRILKTLIGKINDV